jgi:Uncharacterized conserved protein (DUF2293)
VGGQSHIPLQQRVQAATLAHIRHIHTNYDALLREGTEKGDARRAIEKDCLEKLISWRSEDEKNIDLVEGMLCEIIHLDDDDDAVKGLEEDENGRSQIESSALSRREINRRNARFKKYEAVRVEFKTKAGRSRATRPGQAVSQPQKFLRPAPPQPLSIMPPRSYYPQHQLPLHGSFNPPMSKSASQQFIDLTSPSPPRHRLGFERKGEIRSAPSYKQYGIPYYQSSDVFLPRMQPPYTREPVSYQDYSEVVQPRGPPSTSQFRVPLPDVPLPSVEGGFVHPDERHQLNTAPEGSLGSPANDRSKIVYNDPVHDPVRNEADGRYYVAGNYPHSQNMPSLPRTAHNVPVLSTKELEAFGYQRSQMVYIDDCTQPLAQSRGEPPLQTYSNAFQLQLAAPFQANDFGNAAEMMRRYDMERQRRF